jgi:diacylglycerol kinase family enzyme
LNLLLVGDISLPQTLQILPRLLMGKHLSHPKVRTQPFQTLQIQATKPVPIAADGEYLGLSQQISIRILAGRLAVVAATNH